ncbi:unnamed protein product, partial [Mesorhabditis belari]|uniref:Uncharacterized protein n=1 Tax=Mesorhabditis belari TaxID=2138241 RepID=A0AAF3EHV1_9BILA
MDDLCKNAKIDVGLQVAHIVVSAPIQCTRTRASCDDCRRQMICSPLNAMLLSLAQCFVYRHYQILPVEHRFRFSKQFYIIIASLHYLTLPTVSFLLIQSATEEVAMYTPIVIEMIQKEYPELVYLLVDRDLIHVNLKNPIAPPIINFSGEIGCPMYTFLIAIEMLTLTLVPLISISLPWIFISIMMAFKSSSPPAMMNLAFLVNGLHGTMSSLLILYFIEPYRMYLVTFLPTFLKPKPKALIVPALSSTTAVTQWNGSLQNSSAESTIFVLMANLNLQNQLLDQLITRGYEKKTLRKASIHINDMAK